MGLVEYDSSSDEEEVKVPVTASAVKNQRDSNYMGINVIDRAPPISTTDTPASETVPGPALGPSMGPAMPPREAAYDFPELEEELAPDEFSNLGDAEQRAASRMLTLPKTTTDLPTGQFLPSNSPAPSNRKAIASLSSKKSGNHFNHKINISFPFQNPAIATKLTQIISDDNLAQYVNVLPKSMWDPAIIPTFREHLMVMDAVTRLLSKPRGKGQPVSFVPATVGSQASGIAGTKRKADAE